MSESILRIDLQNDSGFREIPEPALFERWVRAALQRPYTELEQTIRIVDEAESRRLNRDYRGRDKPTNVLSFPSELPPELLDYECLGDLVICAPVVEAEAREQGKPPQAHWAHLVVHGMLHLQGLDHETEAEAASMEALEIEILKSLGHTNPYLPT